MKKRYINLRHKLISNVLNLPNKREKNMEVREIKMNYGTGEDCKRSGKVTVKDTILIINK